MGQKNIDKYERYSAVGISQELFWKLCGVKSPRKCETLAEEENIDNVDVGWVFYRKCETFREY